jgi:hypothetical protein
MDSTEKNYSFETAEDASHLNRVVQCVGLCATVIAVLLLAGCAKSVQVESSFPKPLVQPYPLVVGIRYPASLTGFSHTEESANEPEIVISLGTANVDMFRALFNGMFAETVELGSDPNAPVPASIDLIIEPTLADLEIASPGKSGTDQYTVWLNYNLRLSRPDGTLLGDWKVTAYGQRDQGSMGMGGEDAVNGATVIALRDAAASIVSEFSTAPGIASILPAATAPKSAAAAQPAEVAEPAAAGDDTGNGASED